MAYLDRKLNKLKDEADNYVKEIHRLEGLIKENKSNHRKVLDKIKETKVKIMYQKLGIKKNDTVFFYDRENRLTKGKLLDIAFYLSSDTLCARILQLDGVNVDTVIYLYNESLNNIKKIEPNIN